MASMNFDEDGLLEEPCLSCDKPYVEDIWYEWCCDEKECSHRAEKEEPKSAVQKADEEYDIEEDFDSETRSI